MMHPKMRWALPKKPRGSKVLRVAGKLAGVYGKMLRWTPGWTLGGAVVGLGTAVAFNRLNGATDSGTSWVSPVLAAALGGFLGGTAGTFRALTVDVRDNRFGICSGRPPGTDLAPYYRPEQDDEALWNVHRQRVSQSDQEWAKYRADQAEKVICRVDVPAGTPVASDWLCERIDTIAGLGKAEPPLTFGMLEDEAVGVTLRMVTTNVSQNQPYELPFGRNCFLFNTKEMLRVFPPKIVRHLVQHSFQHPKVTPPPGFHYLPEKRDLPVAVAMRMSLSFPVLLSAVCLYTLKREARYDAVKNQPVKEDDLLKNWFSDGGISSNFPIHFFDGWLPSRPTFGINLTAVPEDKARPELAHVGGSVNFEAGEDRESKDVVLPKANVYPAVEVHSIKQLVSFLAAIFSTAQNYRDNMQSTLPSYRERIVQVRLKTNEGGLNLDMPHQVLKDIVDKGEEAGARLLESYDEGDGFDHHRWVRYLVLMNLLEKELTTLHERLRHDEVGFRTTFVAQKAALTQEPGDKFPYSRPEPWCTAAEQLTQELEEFLSRWVPQMKEAVEEARKAGEAGEALGALGALEVRKNGRKPHFIEKSPKDEPVLRVVPRI